MIKLENVSISLGDFHLKNISLEINSGEYFVILGPSGAGKTILLEAIAGIHNLDEGKIYFDDIDVSNILVENRGVGFVYQDYMLFPHKTVFQNISFGLEMAHKPKDEIESSVDEMAELLSIGHLLERYPKTLSGGEKQRVALARALIIYPKVLILDEPLSALDKKTREDLMIELKKIHNEFDITILHVTHNFDEALTLAERVTIMSKGEISQVGTSSEVFRKPRDKFVADFVGVENIIPGSSRLNEDVAIVDTGNIEVVSSENKEGDVHFTVRPEDIIIANEEISSSARNKFEGKIVEIIEQGALIKLNVDIGEIIAVYVTRQSFFDLELNIGSNIWVFFKASAVHLF